MNRIATLAFVAALLPIATVSADDAPAAGGATAQETIPPPDCHKPPVITKMRKADDDSDFQERADAFKACINAYADAQSKLSQQHLAAANAAISQFNDFVKEVNARKQDK